MSLRCLAVAAALLSVPSLRAADDPLDAFPADTGVVLRLASPSDLAEKSQAFLKNAAPQFAQLAGQIGPGLGSLIGNPTLAGVDAARPWYVAVLPRPKGAPALVFAAPAADATALKKAVGQGYTFADYENWVVYSLDTEAVKKAQARVGGAGKPIREALGGAAGQVFADGDVALFLNVPVLREAYQPQIDEAQRQLTDAAAPQTGAAAQREALSALLNAIEDMTAVAAHIVVGEKALTKEAIIAVAPGSRLAEGLARQTPSDFPLLARLPRGRVMYYAVAGDLSELISISTQMTSAIYPQNGELAKRLEELKNFKFSEIAGLFELGGLQDGVYRGVTVANVDQPEKYLALAREMVKAMGHVESSGLQQDVTLQAEAETIDAVKVDLVNIVMTPDPNADRTGAGQRFVKALFGKHGMTQRMTVAEGLFVQAIGPPAVMEEALGALKGNATGDEAAAKAVDAAKAQLGEANLLVLLDVPRLLSGAIRLAVESGDVPLPVDANAVEGIKLVPSFTSATAAAGPNELRLRAAIPAEQVRGIVDLLHALQQAPRRNRAE